ncbi:polysaccharide deacetylase family protein [Asticcacaulis machinosus]|uniref:Chitooligosaccharide deacetylase n=1 Tax=Asticcacaulis machinosus TaxID=2984211 RepID=A0ABT5HGN2_9CAUL|nr:polysaccharide deacetylase family protein [Asticcacaulis machinosus]MDC7675419.1 polysaccharide deacetylase family protein [Asticcacaulis machinosus]
MSEAIYSADRSLYGKLRRRVSKLIYRKPARLEGLKRPLITFSFDDAPQSALTEGAQILEAYGARGTYFISTGLMGNESHLGKYLTGNEVRQLADRGHEIACHTYEHLDCGRADAKTIAQSLAHNRAALAALGITGISTFAYPYGDVSPQAKAVLNNTYTSARALHHGLITTGTDLNQAPAIGIEGADGEANGLKWLEAARATPDSWLVLYTHDVRETPSTWGCTIKTFESLVKAARDHDFEIVTYAKGIRRAA